MLDLKRRLLCAIVAVSIAATVLCGCSINYGSVDAEKVDLINNNEYLKREISQKDEEIASLQKTLDDLNKEYDGISLEVKEFESAVSTLKTDVDDKDAKIKELEASIADLQSLIAEKEESILALENKRLIEFDPSVPYHTMYPNLYAQPADKYVTLDQKVVYITFDDGPSDRTDEILEILDKYNVKATFFVMPRKTDLCYKRLRAIIEAGHTIGIHTYSHDYKTIYASVEAYLEDFNKAYEIVVEATGIKPSIFRFPGGSLNNKDFKIIAEMTRRGFTYYDWNASGDDSVSDPVPTTQSIYDNSIFWVTKRKEAILLLHDEKSKKYTVEALPSIIETLIEKGYTFMAMDNTVTPYQQRKMSK